MGEEIVTAYVAGGCRVRVSRWVYAAVSLAQMLTLAGAIFGWPSMSLMLVDAGLFAEGCPADVAPGVACASQATTISLLFTVASVCVFVAPLPTGIFADYAGPRRALILMTSLSALGFALLVVSLRAGVPRLLFAAFGALGASTAMNLPLYSVANAFPGHEGMVMSLLNGAFDASSIVFVVFAAVVSATGVDLGTVALGFLVGPLAALLVTSFLLWRDEHFDVHPSSLPSLAPLQPPGQEGGEAAAATGGAGDVASASAEEGLVVLPLPAGPSEPSPGTTSPRLSPGGRRLRAATAAFAVGSSRTIAGLGRSGSSGASLARIASQSSLPRAVCSPALSPVLEGGGERADSRGMPGELELDGGRASSAASPEDTLAAAAPAPLGEDVVAAPSSIAVAVVEAAPAAAAPEGGEEASVPGAGSIANAGAEAASPDSRAAGSSLEPDIGTAAVIFTPLPFPAAPADSSGGESQNERRASASIYSAIDGVDYDRLQALSFHAQASGLRSDRRGSRSSPTIPTHPHPQVRTPEFLAYIGFHVVAMLHMYFFLGSARCAAERGVRRHWQLRLRLKWPAELTCIVPHASLQRAT